MSQENVELLEGLCELSAEDGKEVADLLLAGERVR